MDYKIIRKLREKYNSFYWSCILYFYLNGYNYEMLLKKRTNDMILKNKNPRIQITNATCELEQFSPPDTSKTNTNINNINILNLNPNISINMNKTYKKKDLKKVVKNCDKDIYQPNKDYDKENIFRCCAPCVRTGSNGRECALCTGRGR